MIMAGFEFMDDIPFKDVYLHGTVRDDSGKKMSKSLGNSIDPLEIIADYGTDALRFSLISMASMGQDVYLSKEKFEFGRNFCNKIWNASRFILLNIKTNNFAKSEIPLKEDLCFADAWILSRVSSTLKKLNKSLEQYRLNESANIIYEFFWHQFCDWYIEFSKITVENKSTMLVLYNVLEKSLRMLHPFMPFITDEIWQKVTGNNSSIMGQSWPEINEAYIDSELEDQMQSIMEVCTSIRNLRSEKNIKPKDVQSVIIATDNAKTLKVQKDNEAYITSLVRIKNITFLATTDMDNPIALKTTGGGCLISMIVKGADAIDAEQEKERIENQLNELNLHIMRKNKLLNNENYVKKAPALVVAKERESLLELENELEKLEKIKNTFK